LGIAWGVRLSLTPLTWLGPPLFFALGLVLTVTQPGMAPETRLIDGFQFMLGVELATLVHAIGHIASGKVVRAPMDELLITALRYVNLYDGDQSAQPRFVHIGRALGGPMANLLLAALFYSFLAHLPPGAIRDLAGRLQSVSLFIGLGSFLPIPSVDGEVIWRELWKR
jgi:hypothetical protein